MMLPHQVRLHICMHMHVDMHMPGHQHKPRCQLAVISALNE